MGHVNHGDALALELLNDGEERFNLVVVQRRGNFVQQQQFRLEENGLGDLQHALCGRHQRLHIIVRIALNLEAIEQIGDDGARGLFVHETALGDGFATEQDVVHDGHRRDQAQILKRRCDALLAGVHARANFDRPAVKQNFTAVGRDKSRQNLDHGGLTGAVGADQRRDFAGVHR